MKIKDGFILQNVAGDTVAMPVGTDGDQLVTLNDTGAFLWEHMQEETTQEALVQALLGEYEVDAQTAAECVKNFVTELEKNGLLAG